MEANCREGMNEKEGWSSVLVAGDRKLICGAVSPSQTLPPHSHTGKTQTHEVLHKQT